MNRKQKHVDIAVLTAKPEEYRAFYQRLENPYKWQGTKERPNQYAWTLGTLSAAAGKFKIALGLTQEQTNVPAAIAALATFSVFRPRYLIFMGIAGSLDPTVRKGDVFIAEYVWAYQYGRILESGVLQPYSQLQEATDLTLRTNAAAFDSTSDWSKLAGQKPDGSGYPKLYLGGLAAGDTVIENAVTGYFAPVREHDHWLRAVDMEAAGLALAVRHLKETEYTTGLMVVRGISDMPGGSDPADASVKFSSDANRDIRKEWTAFASNAAAVFLEQYIKNAFPYAPAPDATPTQEGAGNKRWHHLDAELFASYQSHFVRADEITVIHAINDETFDPAVLVPKSTLEGWWRANPLSIGLVRSASGDAVGYWNLLPLSREAFDGMVEGRMVEREILPTQVTRYQELENGSVYLYIAAVSARVKRQPSSAAVVLDFLTFLQLLARRIGIDAISAQLVSPDALPLVAYFEMTMVREKAGVSTWVLDSKKQIERALRKGRQEVRRLKGWVPEFSSRDRRAVMGLLKR